MCSYETAMVRGSGLIITRVVLKSLWLRVEQEAESRLIITRVVLKFENWDYKMYFLVFNNNKSCIEIQKFAYYQNMFEAFNNNKSCIEIHKTMAYHYIHSLFNNNKSCIEILYSESKRSVTLV